VVIEQLRFEDSSGAGILISTGHDVTVANCAFERVLPGLVVGRLLAIGVFAVFGPIATITVVKNEFDIGGLPTSDSSGVILNAPPGAVEVADNTVRNTTAHGIDLRNIGGPAHIERNRVETGSVGRGGGPGQFVDGIRCVGTGTYVIEHNSVNVGFE